MTSIQKLKAEKKEQDKKLAQDALNTSTKEFTKQKSSIQAISKTPGFKTIKDFWILQEKQAMQDLKNVRFTDLQEFGRVQAKSQVASKFILFLNNLDS